MLLKKYTRGFSLIELIVTLVLVGVVSITVMSRFFGSSGLEEAVARDTLISTLRATQQTAMAGLDVSFVLELAGEHWQLEVKEGSETTRSARMPAAGLSLTTGSTASSTTDCSDDFSDAIAGDFALNFDRWGSAVSLTNNGDTDPVENGVRLCINEDPRYSICVSPGGYAFVGACLP